MIRPRRAGRNPGILYLETMGSAMRAGGPWALAAGLVLATLTVYGRVTELDFAGVDDPVYVSRNEHVLDGVSPDGVVWAFTTTTASNWHPLTWLSLMLDAELFGPEPGGFHRTNLAIHVANTLLVYAVFSRMTSRPWPSALVSALFAIHPLHVESVAWISERKEVLSTFFGLLAILAWTWRAERPGVGRQALASVAFAAALLAKPMLVTLPLLLVLLDSWPLARTTATASGLAGSLREKLPLLALSIGSCVATLVAQQGAIRSLERFPLPLRAANALVSYAWYLVKAVWPSGLAVLYPYDREPAVGAIAGGALLVSGVSAIVLFGARKRPYLAVGWLWYLVALVPVLGIVQVGLEPRADRYAYVPLLGVFLAVAWGAADLARAGDRRGPMRTAAIGSASVVAIVALALAARAQVERWRDAETAFRHTIAVHPTSHRAHVGLALELSRSGRSGEAVAHLREAVRIAPDDVTALVNLGSTLVARGSIEEAIAIYRRALPHAPEDADLRANLGIALERRGRLDEAEAALREALALDPSYALTHKGLGLLLARRERLDEALVHLERAVAEDPGDVATRLNLAIVLVRLGRHEVAERELREVLRRDPANAVAHKRLGMALAGRGRFAEAVTEIEASLRIDPAQPDLRRDLERLREHARR
jgi:Flp pilus assembly protein TadD